MTFGFRASPGEYSMTSDGIDEVNHNTVPVEPHWQGPEPYDSETYVDDGGMVAAALECRAEDNQRSYGSAMTALLGEEPINPEKHALEGGWSTAGIQ